MKHLSYKAVLLAIFTFQCIIALAQQGKVDSLYGLYNKEDAEKLELLNLIAQAYYEFNADSSLAVSERLIKIAEEEGNALILVEALNNKGLALERKGDEEEALKVFKRTLGLAKRHDFEMGEAEAYHHISTAYYHTADYDSALTMAFSALKIFKTLNLKEEVASVLNSIGNVYYFIETSDGKGDLINSELYYKNSLEIYKELNDKEGLAKQYGNLGLIYGRRGDKEKSILYSQKSLDYYKEVGRKIGIATSYVNLGYVYYNFGYYNKAVESVNEALKIREEIDDKKGIALCYDLIASIYTDLKDYRKAYDYYKKSYDYSREINFRRQALSSMHSLAQRSEDLGNYKAAAEWYGKYGDLKDSIYNDEIANQVTEAEARYKSLEKDAEIQLLQKEAEVKDLSLKRNDAYLTGAVIAIVLLWIILGISYWAYRSKNKSNYQLALRNKEILRQKQEITDSINYAKTIQSAILPPENLIDGNDFSSFVFFRPKDIVSGDFYWMDRIGDRVYFAAVDCTGHGVPGAFMSIIGHNCLGQSIKDYELRKPAEILDRMTILVTESLRNNGNTSVKDGMDMALCCFHPKEMKLEYAGAYNPLYIVRGGEVLQFKADRQPVGPHENRSPYTNHIIDLESGDCIYVFSDGLQDQFGGPQDKKFSGKRLRNLLASMAEKSIETQYVEVEKAFNDWKGEQEQTDDVTLMCLKV